MKYILASLFFLSGSIGTASADFTDTCGRQVTVVGDTYTVTGKSSKFIVTVDSLAKAQNTINSLLTDDCTVPVAAPVTSIATSSYIARFSPAEQLAVTGNPTTLTLWLTLLSYQVIDVTKQQVIDGMKVLVSAGVITPARAAVILDLSKTSP